MAKDRRLKKCAKKLVKRNRDLRNKIIYALEQYKVDNLTVDRIYENASAMHGSFDTVSWFDWCSL